MCTYPQVGPGMVDFILKFVIRIDNEYSDGYSIFQFNFSKDDDNVNRYNHWEGIDSKVTSPECFFKNGVLVLCIDDLFKQINPGLEIDESWIRRLTSFDNNNVSQIRIPFFNLTSFENSEYNKLGVLIKYKDYLCGYILICWKRLEDHGCEMHQDIKVRLCTLVGGGSFYPWFSLTEFKCNINNHVCGLFIPSIESQIICKSRSKISYQSDMLHDTGICYGNAKFKWAGDHKYFNYLFGIPSPSVKCVCPYCKSTSQERNGLPTPSNRSWGSRHRVDLEQSWVQSVAGESNQSCYNLTKPPLLIASPSSLCLAVLHQIQGPSARLFTIIKNRIVDVSNEPQKLTIWNRLNVEIGELTVEIKQYQETIKWIANDKCEDYFDHDFLRNLDSNVKKLQDAVLAKQEEMKEKSKELDDLNVNQNSDSRLRFLAMCDELKIKPWHHKGDTMHGPSVKKFLYNHDIALKYLNNVVDAELIKLMKPCLVRLRFIARCFWTKTEETINDECINYLKWNLIEWDHIYHCIIHQYGGGKGHRYGNKHHMFYHSYEFMEWSRISPAWMDDERVEQFNVHIAKFLPIYSCFRGHKNLKRMMNKLWREFVLG